MRIVPILLALSVSLVPTAMARSRSRDPDKANPSVKVSVDTTEVPDLAAWAEEAKTQVETWYPKVSKLLATEGFTPPTELKLVFKKEKKGIADASGIRIEIAADWVRKHPDDLGMVIHEMTHVIQAYPPSRSGWLVEGIADYVRYFKFEPQKKLAPIDPKTAKYRDGYGTTARFLAWIEAEHDKELIAKLNQALRQRRYTPELFKEYTGKNLDALWAEFVNGLPDKMGKG